MIKAFEKKHYLALARLRGSAEFGIVVEGIKAQLDIYLVALMHVDDDSEYKRIQGRARELAVLLETISKAPEYVEKLTE